MHRNDSDLTHCLDFGEGNLANNFVSSNKIYSGYDKFPLMVRKCNVQIFSFNGTVLKINILRLTAMNVTFSTLDFERHSGYLFLLKFLGLLCC